MIYLDDLPYDLYKWSKQMIYILIFHKNPDR